MHTHPFNDPFTWSSLVYAHPHLMIPSHGVVYTHPFNAHGVV